MSLELLWIYHWPCWARHYWSIDVWYISLYTSLKSVACVVWLRLPTEHRALFYSSLYWPCIKVPKISPDSHLICVTLNQKLSLHIQFRFARTIQSAVQWISKSQPSYNGWRKIRGVLNNNAHEKFLRPCSQTSRACPFGVQLAIVKTGYRDSTTENFTSLLNTLRQLSLYKDMNLIELSCHKTVCTIKYMSLCKLCYQTNTE